MPNEKRIVVRGESRIVSSNLVQLRRSGAVQMTAGDLIAFMTSFSQAVILANLDLSEQVEVTDVLKKTILEPCLEAIYGTALPRKHEEAILSAYFDNFERRQLQVVLMEGSGLDGAPFALKENGLTAAFHVNVEALRAVALVDNGDRPVIPEAIFALALTYYLGGIVLPDHREAVEAHVLSLKRWILTEMGQLETYMERFAGGKPDAISTLQEAVRGVEGMDPDLTRILLEDSLDHQVAEEDALPEAPPMAGFFGRPLASVEKIFGAADDLGEDPYAITINVNDEVIDFRHGVKFRDQYKFSEHIGSGSFGRVRRVVDLKVDRPLAGKLVRMPHQVEMSDGDTPAEREAKLASYREAAKRAAREAVFYAELGAHRSIPALIDVWGLYQIHEEEGRVSTEGSPEGLILMQYAPGKNVSDGIREAQAQGVTFDPQSAATVIREVVDGLEFAHGKGVVHRDIKGDNLVASYNQMTQEWEVMIIDWGLGKRVTKKGDLGPGSSSRRSVLDAAIGIDSDSRREAATDADGIFLTADLTVVSTDSEGRMVSITSETGEGRLLGTPGYLPPESINQDWGPESDIYSLGVVFYRMVTGGENVIEPARTTGGMMEYLSDLGNSYYRNPGAHNEELRGTMANGGHALEYIILKMLAPKRTYAQSQKSAVRYNARGQRIWRYETMAEVKADLDAFLEGRPLGSALEAGLGEEYWTVVRRTEVEDMSGRQIVTSEDLVRDWDETIEDLEPLGVTLAELQKKPAIHEIKEPEVEKPRSWSRFIWGSLVSSLIAVSAAALIMRGEPEEFQVIVASRQPVLTADPDHVAVNLIIAKDEPPRTFDINLGGLDDGEHVVRYMMVPGDETSVIPIKVIVKTPLKVDVREDPFFTKDPKLVEVEIVVDGVSQRFPLDLDDLADGIHYVKHPVTNETGDKTAVVSIPVEVNTEGQSWAWDGTLDNLDVFMDRYGKYVHLDGSSHDSNGALLMAGTAFQQGVEIEGRYEQFPYLYRHSVGIAAGEQKNNYTKAFFLSERGVTMDPGVETRFVTDLFIQTAGKGHGEVYFGLFSKTRRTLTRINFYPGVFIDGTLVPDGDGAPLDEGGVFYGYPPVPLDLYGGGPAHHFNRGPHKAIYERGQVTLQHGIDMKTWLKLELIKPRKGEVVHGVEFDGLTVYVQLKGEPFYREGNNEKGLYTFPVESGISYQLIGHTSGRERSARLANMAVIVESGKEL